MNLARFLAAHRPVVILMLLVSLSLASLATGTEATFIQRGIKRLVSITSYPFLRTRYLVEKGLDYTLGVAFDYQALQTANAQLQYDVISLKQE
ncbi:MAG: hypothetical protein HYZ00_04235, partial [Candidatus Hydrogenedentes bacterium]|nr:hypothetical protein [Candidatus Hydrogenedentota bacterium]